MVYIWTAIVTLAGANVKIGKQFCIISWKKSLGLFHFQALFYVIINRFRSVYLNRPYPKAFKRELRQNGSVRIKAELSVSCRGSCDFISFG